MAIFQHTVKKFTEVDHSFDDRFHVLDELMKPAGGLRRLRRRSQLF